MDILRDMAQKYNIKYFYDITDRSDFRANPDYKGVCHIALAQVRGGERGREVMHTQCWHNTGLAWRAC